MMIFLFIASGLLLVFLLVGLFISYRFQTDGTAKGRLVSIFTSYGMFIPGAVRINTLYSMWGSHVMSHNTTFINLGYWKNADCMDDAGRDLAHLLAEHANISIGDDVLDVGFGYGDQDIRSEEHTSELQSR